MNPLEHIVIIGKNYKDMPMTVAELRKQYSTGYWKDTWPRLGYRALLKPFTYEEFNNIIQRGVRLTSEQLNLQCKVDYFLGTQTREPDYAAVVRSGGFEAFQESYKEHEAVAERKAQSTQAITAISKEYYENNKFLRCRITIYPDQPLGLVFWIVKKNPHRITFNFYRYENGGNKKFCDEFMKLSPRYMLDDGWS